MRPPVLLRSQLSFAQLARLLRDVETSEHSDSNSINSHIMYSSPAELCDGSPWSVECAGPCRPHHASQQVHRIIPANTQTVSSTLTSCSKSYGYVPGVHKSCANKVEAGVEEHLTLTIFVSG